jgi:hypothetical protein
LPLLSSAEFSLILDFDTPTAASSNTPSALVIASTGHFVIESASVARHHRKTDSFGLVPLLSHILRC